MKKFIYFLIFLSAAFIWSCNRIEDEPALTGENSFANAGNGDIIPGQFIVQLKDGATPIRSAKMSYPDAQLAMRNEIRKILTSSAISVRDPLFVYTASIEGFAVKLSDAEAEMLKKNDAVLRISPDRVITLGKPGSPSSNYPTPQRVPWGILRVHGIAHYSGNNKVWIIDTGVDSNHQDLNVSQDLGASFVNSGTDDGYGHGTACAGVIAAKNDNYGVVGVAPGALVVPVKVLDNNGNGTVSAAIAGVDYVSDHAQPNDVVSMCLGTSIEPALDAAVIALAGKPVFVAVPAGNDSADADNVSPARADNPKIFTVSSFMENDACERPGFPFSASSNFGSHVDYSEPGEYIVTTYKNNTLCRWSGTSMSAAHMAGVLLVTQGNPVTDGTVLDDPDDVDDPIAVTGEDYWKLNPVVETGVISAISMSTAFANFQLISDGGADIRKEGVCWNTTGNPVIENDPKSIAILYHECLISGLQPGIEYHVRAFATNLTTTTYGEEKTFTTPSADVSILFKPGITYGEVSDIDGNKYKTIQVGSKTWMAENLRTTKFSNGEAISNITDNAEWTGLTSPGYCWFFNDRETYASTYGALYNWYAVSPVYTGNRNICPEGWHVPGKDEMSAMIKSLGGESVAGGKLKESGTDHWAYPNTGAANSSGFTSLPGGMRVSGPECWWTDENMAFKFLNQASVYWTSTVTTRWEGAANVLLGPSYDGTQANIGPREFNFGFSVRCVKD